MSGTSSPFRRMFRQAFTAPSNSPDSQTWVDLTAQADEDKCWQCATDGRECHGGDRDANKPCGRCRVFSLPCNWELSSPSTSRATHGAAAAAAAARAQDSDASPSVKKRKKSTNESTADTRSTRSTPHRRAAPPASSTTITPLLRKLRSSSRSSPVQSSPRSTPRRSKRDLFRRLAVEEDEDDVPLASPSNTKLAKSPPASASSPVRPRSSQTMAEGEPPSRLAADGRASPEEADSPEMEDWEVAPGRIRSVTAERPENIAFSNAYLSATDGLPVDDGIAFHVEIARPGHTRRFEADDAVTRVCSLAAGKLRVQIDGEAEFSIGPQGMFKVNPGLACDVSNRLYVQAVLHVSSVSRE